MQTKIQTIKKELSKKRFGLQSLFYQPLELQEDQIIVKITPEIISGLEYDCYIATAKGFKEMQKQTPKISLCYGRDELNIWKRHYFLIINEQQIDLTPLYNLSGLNHIIEGKLTQKDIDKEEEKQFYSLNHLHPLRINSNENSTQISMLGIETSKTRRGQIKTNDSEIIYRLITLKDKQKKNDVVYRFPRGEIDSQILENILPEDQNTIKALSRNLTKLLTK